MCKVGLQTSKNGVSVRSSARVVRWPGVRVPNRRRVDSSQTLHAQPPSRSSKCVHELLSEPKARPAPASAARQTSGAPAPRPSRPHTVVTKGVRTALSVIDSGRVLSRCLGIGGERPHGAQVVVKLVEAGGRFYPAFQPGASHRADSGRTAG